MIKIKLATMSIKWIWGHMYCRNVFGFWLVVIFFGCHSDKLLGSFGNVIGALDDLLSDQLDVRRAGVVIGSLLALSVQPAGARREQTQRSSHGL